MNAGAITAGAALQEKSRGRPQYWSLFTKAPITRPIIREVNVTTSATVALL
jgi:hypothetical protein